jgi:hypothetical protein
MGYERQRVEQMTCAIWESYQWMEASCKHSDEALVGR